VVATDRQKRINIDVTFPEDGDKVSYNTWYTTSPVLILVHVGSWQRS